MTVLIGENSVGKSTVLQVLELLSYFTQGKKYQECFNHHFIKANYLSDGVMRILAILTLSLLGEPVKTIMIEEIEEGVHPYLIEKMVEMLISIAQAQAKQFILTTHNPSQLFIENPSRGYSKSQNFPKPTKS